MEEIIQQSLASLAAYIESRRWKGYDPYDALNSPLLRMCSFNSSLLRVIYIQILKRLPLNFRRPLGVRQEYNPKAMGLFLTSYMTLYKATRDSKYLDKARFFINWLTDNSLDGYAGRCWGYSFPWQNIQSFTSAGTPSVIHTYFAANAFLDAYEVLNDEKYLEVARSSCDFVTNSLRIFDMGNGKICFSYTPFSNAKVHNANLLAASLLSRVYSVTGEDTLRDYADRAVSFSIDYQNDDGSWYYSASPGRNWIDSFHTGFVLESLYDHARFSNCSVTGGKVDIGLSYYRSTFFRHDGLPRYYDTRTYPVDIHNAAQGITVFAKLRDLDQSNLEHAQKIALWAIRNMQDTKGYFYYQKTRYYCNRIPYMRWSQAWMFRALASLAEALKIVPS